MQINKPTISLAKIVLYCVGYLVIVAIPTSFFAFGWKSLDLNCEREAIGSSPSCTIIESFGIKLYSKIKRVQNIQQIGYESSSGLHAGPKTTVKTATSTLVFYTSTGVEQITHSVESSKEKELILKTRAFLNNPQTLKYSDSFSLRSIFGWIGLIGTSLILLVVLEVARYHLFSSKKK